MARPLRRDTINKPKPEVDINQPLEEVIADAIAVCAHVYIYPDPEPPAAATCWAVVLAGEPRRLAGEFTTEDIARRWALSRGLQLAA